MKRLEMIKAYNGKTVLINLTQHKLTPEQKEGFNEIVDSFDFTEDLTFNTIPSSKDVFLRAKQIAGCAAEIAEQYPECIPVALIGGAPYLMGKLEDALRVWDIIPVYAFSKRTSVETVQPDGSVVKTTIFKHEGYIEA